jgi:hypothetical protein
MRVDPVVSGSSQVRNNVQNLLAVRTEFRSSHLDSEHALHAEHFKLVARSTVLLWGVDLDTGGISCRGISD